jgi:hypothetical protein
LKASLWISFPRKRNKSQWGYAKSPFKKQAAPKGAACKIFAENRLDQWKIQPVGVIIDTKANTEVMAHID